MNAARVVADHASERAAIVSGGIWGEGKMVLFGGGAEIVKHYSGLYASDSALGIDFEDPRHVLREVEDDGDVAALPCERRASTTAEQWRSELTAEGDGRQNIVGIVREHDADGDVTVIGAVGGVERSAAGVESDVTVGSATNLRAQSFSQTQRVHPRGLWSLGEFDESVWHAAGSSQFTDDSPRQDLWVT
jgi:hypothetical protein